MKRSAVFVAGDENIYFPALVTLLSVREHNPEQFDLFMCFSGDKLTPYMKSKLKEKNINFVDTRILDEYGIKDKFPSMLEGHWPVDIFYNYVLPIYLGELGYEYSYKVDYDILCIDKYSLNEIEPTNAFISGWSNKVSLQRENVTEHLIGKLISEGKIKDKTVDYMNVGFIGFNNKKYSESDMFSLFADFYRLLHDNCPKAKLLEQVAFALVVESTKGNFKRFAEKYNHRVLSTRDTDSDFNFDTKNIHFITRFKPWRAIEKDKVKWFVFNGGTHMYLYRNMWLEYASKIDGFDYFCMERPLTTSQLAGLQMYIVRCFNEKIKSLSS